MRSDGQLVCFGDNTCGQCDVPTDLGAVVAVTAGKNHTCAVRSDGRLVCFGYNAFGQCMVPTDLGAVVAVSAGDDHTCAVRSDGQLICFGSNAHGQCDVPTDLGAVVGVPLGYQQALITRVKSGHLPTGDAVIEPEDALYSKAMLDAYFGHLEVADTIRKKPFLPGAIGLITRSLVVCCQLLLPGLKVPN